MRNDRRYAGIQHEINGGMTDTGRLIRDAWVFGLIPESETCEGWLASGIEALWIRVDAEWEKYGFRVGQLPEDLRERHRRIHGAALEQARQAGWDPAGELAADD